LVLWNARSGRPLFSVKQGAGAHRKTPGEKERWGGGGGGGGGGGVQIIFIVLHNSIISLMILFNLAIKK